MFLADCKSCGLREVRGPRGVSALVNASDGIGLYYTCTGCGTANVNVTGAMAGTAQRTTAHAA